MAVQIVFRKGEYFVMDNSSREKRNREIVVVAGATSLKKKIEKTEEKAHP